MLLPLIGIVPLMLLPLGTGIAPPQFMSVVKDGQLCWAAVAMGAASLYESWVALEAHKTVAGGDVLLLLVFVMILPAMILAAAGSVFSTPLRTATTGGLGARCSHYKAFVGSLTLCILTAVAYTYLHSQLPP